MDIGTRITYPGACVLQALANDYQYGFDIMDFTGLPSGSVYPILRRFEERGLVRSKWESARAATTDGRPRRRNYQLTKLGETALTVAAERLALHNRMFAGDSGAAKPGQR